MANTRNAVLILHGISAYNNFDTFHAMVGRAINRMGLDAVMIDLKEPSSFNSGMNKVVQDCGLDRVVCALTLNGTGLEIGNDGPNGNIWARIKVPVLSWMGDHPCYYLSRHQHTSPAIGLLYEYGDFFDFHRNYVKTTGQTTYAPFGVWDLGRPTAQKTMRGRTPLIIMPKSGHNPQALENIWKQLPPLASKIIYDALDHYWGQTARSGTPTPSILAAADASGVDLRKDLNAMAEIFKQVDDHIRRTKVKLMVTQLLPLPVQIMGEGLDYIPTAGARATVLPAMAYDKLVDLYYASDAIITMNPNVDDECHDRVYTAFGCGSLPISDINPWWESHYPDLLPYSFDFRHRPVTGAVEKFIADPDAGLHLAWQQRAVAMQRRTFDQTVGQAIDCAMTLRQAAFNKPPLEYTPLPKV